jgi:hypothetical protein
MRRFVLAALLLVVGCQDFDPADRRAANRDEYDIRDQDCEVAGDRAVARGTLTSYADEPQGFSVTVRFFDDDVDLGRPQIVDHVEPIEPGETWDWEASVDAGDATDLRCDVIQVAIGDDVDH